MSMQDEVPSLIESYLAWLKDKTSFKKVSADWIEITTPFLDRHNDCIQIYAKKFGDSYQLTDDGYTLGDLSLSGFEVKSPKRKLLFEQTINGFGIKMRNEALYVEASATDFAKRKHDLIQAMLAVNDMFFLSEANIASLFFEDVTSWMDQKNIRYTPRVKLTGKTGYTHAVDFVIPRSSSAPERLVQLINKPNKNTAERVAFTWVDTSESRAPGTQAIAFLNDKVTTGIPEVSEALAKYNIQPVLWSARETIATALAS